MIERRHVVHGTLLGAGLSGAGLSTGCVTEGEAPDTSAEAPASIRGNGYRLVQDWDFQRTVTTQAQLREHFFTRYIYDNGRLDTLNDEWQRYRDNDNHEFERDGLALVARIPQGKSMGSGQIESGMLRSKWSGQYGYFECSMKVPGARGMWPAFWLNPQDKVWPPEIDIVEIVNNGRDTTRNSFHFVHGPNENNAPRASKLNNNKTYLPGFDYQDDFHTFAVEWTAERVTHYVDDVMVVQRDFRWVHKDGKDAGPAHVLLNLAVGGAWPGPPPGPQVFPARLLVKYIRVWQAS